MLTQNRTWDKWPWSRPALCGRRAVWLAGLLALASCLSSGCLSSDQDQVVVYTALDQDFSEKIFRQFTRRTGIVVRAKYDTEATKTVHLTESILAERSRPRCDVFWNNEILHTIRLSRAGVLDTYRSGAASGFPPMARSADGTWHGFAARARVLIVNTERVPRDRWPTSVTDLARPEWKGRVGIAKPLFGTTATHAACLFAYWGDQRAEAFFTAVKDNAQIMAGNKQVALAVAGGALDFGLTDTDDAVIEREKGMPVAIVYPDQGADGMGTLFLPNSVAILRHAPHGDAARRLVDYLLSARVEALLAEGPSAQIPLNPQVQVALRVETPATIRAMPVDFERAVDKWPTAARFLRDTFTGAD